MEEYVSVEAKNIYISKLEVIRMKTLNEPFEDKEWKRLVKAKGELTWHDFIMQLAGEE